MKQVGRGVVPLRVAPAIGWNVRCRLPEPDLSLEAADGGDAPFDLAHVVDVDAPSVADDLAVIGDLASGFGVERGLAKQHRDAPVIEAAKRGDLRLDRDGVVADEGVRRDTGCAAHRGARRGVLAGLVERLPFPLLCAVGADAELARLPLRLR